MICSVTTIWMIWSSLIMRSLKHPSLISIFVQIHVCCLKNQDFDKENCEYLPIIIHLKTDAFHILCVQYIIVHYGFIAITSVFTIHFQKQSHALHHMFIHIFSCYFNHAPIYLSFILIDSINTYVVSIENG